MLIKRKASFFPNLCFTPIHLALLSDSKYFSSYAHVRSQRNYRQFLAGQKSFFSEIQRKNRYNIQSIGSLRIASLTTGEYPSVHCISGFTQTRTVFFSLQMAGSIILLRKINKNGLIRRGLPHK